MMRILVMTAVSAEREAVLRGLGGDGRFHVALAGVGPASAAARTAAELAAAKYDRVVSMGIGGGFADRAGVGSLVVASEIIAADLGAETPDGFAGVDELGFGSARIAVDESTSARIVHALNTRGQAVVSGPVLTASTVTGTQATADMMATRVPGAAAEAMEGYGVAIAAQFADLPVLEIRAVSNPVGPRDRAAWRIGEALAALEAASSILPEVLR